MIGAGSLLSLLVSLPRWPLVRLLLVPAQALAAVGSAMGNLLCLHDGGNDLATAAGAARLDLSRESSRSLPHGPGGGASVGPSTPPRPTLLWSPRGSREHPRASPPRASSCEEEEGQVKAGGSRGSEEGQSPDGVSCASSAVPSLLQLCTVAVARQFDRLDPLQLSQLPGDLFQQVFDALTSTGDLSLSSLKRLPFAPDLHIVCLDGSCCPSEPAGDELLAFLANCPRLHALDLSRCTLVTDKGIAALCIKSPPPALRTGSLPTSLGVGSAASRQLGWEGLDRGAARRNSALDAPRGSVGVGAACESVGQSVGGVTVARAGASQVPGHGVGGGERGSGGAGAARSGGFGFGAGFGAASASAAATRAPAVSPFAAASSGMFTAYGGGGGGGGYGSSSGGSGSGGGDGGGGNSIGSGSGSGGSASSSNSGSPGRSMVTAGCYSSSSSNSPAGSSNSCGNTRNSGGSGGNSGSNSSNSSFASAASAGPAARSMPGAAAVGGWAAAVGCINPATRLDSCGGQGRGMVAGAGAGHGCTAMPGERDGASCSTCGGSAVPLGRETGPGARGGRGGAAAEGVGKVREAGGGGSPQAASAENIPHTAAGPRHRCRRCGILSDSVGALQSPFPSPSFFSPSSSPCPAFSPCPSSSPCTSPSNSPPTAAAFTYAPATCCGCNRSGGGGCYSMGDGYSQGGGGGYTTGGYALGGGGRGYGYCCRTCSSGMYSASSSEIGAAAAVGGRLANPGGVGYGAVGYGGARGLVSLKLNFCIQLTDASLQHVAGLTSLHTLELRCCEHLTSSGLQHLSTLSTLTRLSLRQCPKLRGSLHPLAQSMPLLSSLDIGWCTQLGDAQVSPLAALGASLTHLDLSATRVTDRGVQSLSTLTGLQRLSLKACEVGAAAAATVGSHFSHLTRLELERCTGVNDAACEGLACLRKLRRLGLSCTSVTDTGLNRLSRLTDLRRLDLDSCRVTDAGAKVVLHLPFLRHLNLADTQVQDNTLELLASLARATSAAAATAAAHAAAVAEAARKCGGVGAAGASGWDLPPPPPRAHLEWLSLSFTQVTNDGVSHLKSLSGLTHLNIDSDSLTDAAVLQLKGLTALTALEAFSARIHEPGAAVIAALSNLKRLELCGGGITDSAACHLAKLSHLTYLSLAHNPRLGDAGLSTLLPALPHLEQLNLSSTGITARAATGLLHGLRGLRAVSLVDSRLPESVAASVRAQLPAGCVLKHSCKDRR